MSSEDRVREIVREELVEIPAIAETVEAYLKRKIGILEAKRAWTIHLWGSSTASTLEAVLLKVDNALQSFRKQLLELETGKAAAETTASGMCEEPKYFNWDEGTWDDGRVWR